ncbi:MAG: TetR family transcriptional regulator [Acidobacteria bacterium]|nr:TetR family transcriptional regulator [Acidobacteriota bacterium]
MTEKLTDGGTRTERKRCAILRAAVCEFQANGFQATSMDRVAERAKVSKRTIYNHFENKDALFHSITEELVDQIVRVMDLPYDPARSVESQLAEMARRKVELMTCPGFLNLAKVTIAEHLRAPDLASDTYCRIHEGEGGLLRWIRAAVADNRLDVPDPPVAAEQFSALLSAFVFWPLMFGRPAPSPEELERVVSNTVAMFLDHYRARDSDGSAAA